MNQILESFAQGNINCTINGRPASPDECAEVFTVVGIIFVLIGILLLPLFIWWIFTLVHVIKHEDVPNRIIWLILHFIGLGLIAAPIYHFAVKRPYERSKSSKKK